MSKTGEMIPAWALGATAAAHVMSIRERRLTAALYAQLPGVLPYVRKHGSLPPRMEGARGAEIGVRVLVQRRGVDLQLSEDENRVLEALAVSGVPAGCAVLLEPNALDDPGEGSS